VRPAVGEAGDVAKDLVNEARKRGAAWSGWSPATPLTLDAVVSEAQLRRQVHCGL